MNLKTNINVLITSAGKRVALVRAFKETAVRFSQNSRIYTTDMYPSMAPAGYAADGCFEVPRATSDEYVAQLRQICLDNNIGTVIPTIDTELIVLAKHKKAFSEEGINLIVSDIDFIMTCRDKRNTGEFFQKKGIRVPKPVDKNRPTFPLFAKPYDGSLSADLHYIKTPEQLTKDILENSKLMFMEYIDKSQYKEYTVDMYYGRDHNLKMAVPRERIEIRAGEINKGRTVKSFLENYIHEHLIHIEGCVGCICGQFFYDGLEDVVGIEINPRFGGGYPLSYAAGANYPEFIFREYIMNEKIDYSNDWVDNKLMLRFDDAIFI